MISTNELPILRERLDAALRAGADTSVIRRKIEAAERRQDEEQAAAERANAQRVAVARRAADAEIDRIVSERVAALAQAAGLPITPGCELRAACVALAAAQRQAGAAAVVIADHHAEMVALGERVAALELAKREIAERRAAGDRRAGDAGEVELLGMDLAELNILYSAALARVNAANAQADAAQQAVQQAGQQVQAAERGIVISAALEHQREALTAIGRLDAMLGEQISLADAITAGNLLPALAEQGQALDAMLLATAERIEALHRRTGRIAAPPWGASQALLRMLRGLAAKRGEL